MRLDDLSILSTQQRFHAVATLLARGVRRALSSSGAPFSSPQQEEGEKPQNSAENSLEVRGDLRLTVPTS